jgi:integrase/recombinase XerD
MKTTDKDLDIFYLHLRATFTHPKTSRDKLRYVREYVNWLLSKQITPEEIGYTDLLDFVGFLQDQGKTGHKINRYLTALEDYHQFKKLPFNRHGLRVKSHTKTMKVLLEGKVLESVYENYKSENEVDKLLLSLVIWQALEYEDIVRLEVQDVLLSQGQIYIKSRGRKTARYLPLAAHQVMQLHHYMEATKAKRTALKTDFLIVLACTLYVVWKKLSKAVKAQAIEKTGHKVNNLCHVRQSRLALWVVDYGLRQAQYMGGYKTVQGIERYRSESIRSLQEQLSKCHPLR